MNKSKLKKVLFDIFIKYQGIIVLLVIIDQITKIIALNYFDTPIKIFGLNWLQFKLVFNKGVAFSMLDDAPLWTKAMISLVSFIAIEAYLIVKKPEDKIFKTMLLCIAAGALGNGIDRWLAVFPKVTGYEGVVDFIYVSWFANFNVADIYVTVSCFAMLAYMLLTNNDSKKVKENKKHE